MPGAIFHWWAVKPRPRIDRQILMLESRPVEKGEGNHVQDIGRVGVTEVAPEQRVGEEEIVEVEGPEASNDQYKDDPPAAGDIPADDDTVAESRQDPDGVGD